MTDESKVMVSVEQGDDPKAPFVLKFTNNSGIQDTIVSQVLKMASWKKNIVLEEPRNGFLTSDEGTNLVTKGAFQTADAATAALQLIDETLNGIADKSIPKTEIFPGDVGASIQLFTLDGVRQAAMQARTLAQSIGREK